MIVKRMREYIEQDDVLNLALLLEENKELDIDGLYIDTLFKDIHSYTMLHHAVVKGSVEVVHFLIQKGVDVNKVSDRSAYPLIHASINGVLEIVDLLLEAGADPNIGNGGWTALMAALENNHSDVIDKLLLAGANIHTCIVEENITALHFAVMLKNPVHVQKIINRGAKINEPDVRGLTPLHTAIDGLSEVQTQCIEMLLDAGADLSLQDKDGLTPLHELCLHPKYYDLIKRMLEKGADPNVQDHIGRTALHVLCECTFFDYTQTAALLIEYGADTAIRANSGLRPLHHASAEMQEKLVQIFEVSL